MVGEGHNQVACIGIVGAPAAAAAEQMDDTHTVLAEMQSIADSVEARPATGTAHAERKYSDYRNPAPGSSRLGRTTLLLGRVEFDILHLTVIPDAHTRAENDSPP